MHDIRNATENSLRALHRELRKHLSHFEGNEDDFYRLRRSGMSAASLHSHLAEVSETILLRLRRSSTQPRSPSPIRRSSRQSAALRWALLTWQVRAGPVELHPESEVIVSKQGPDELGQRHTRWVGDFLSLLEGLPEAGFRRVTALHPQFGEMTVAEWARYLRVYARAKELELEA